MPLFDKYVNRHPLDDEHSIAFRSYLEYIIENEEKDINRHYQSIETLCSPCQFPYDYILKVETAPVDSWVVTDRFNSKLGKFYSHSTVNKTVNHPMDIWKFNQKKLQKIYANIPKSIKEKLIERYQVDFTRFEYTFDLDTNLAEFKN